jgi:co-chaperonin GroES (HSP10)
MENRYKMKLRLLGDRILVMPDPSQHMVRGFMLPEKFRGPVTVGRVFAIGSKAKELNPGLEEGHRVVVKPHSGTDFEWRGETMRMFESRDVHLVIGGNLVEAVD